MNKNKLNKYKIDYLKTNKIILTEDKEALFDKVLVALLEDDEFIGLKEIDIYKKTNLIFETASEYVLLSDFDYEIFDKIAEFFETDYDEQILYNPQLLKQNVMVYLYENAQLKPGLIIEKSFNRLVDGMMSILSILMFLGRITYGILGMFGPIRNSNLYQQQMHQLALSFKWMYRFRFRFLTFLVDRPLATKYDKTFKTFFASNGNQHIANCRIKCDFGNTEEDFFNNINSGEIVLGKVAKHRLSKTILLRDREEEKLDNDPNREDRTHKYPYKTIQNEDPDMAIKIRKMDCLLNCILDYYSTFYAYAYLAYVRCNEENGVKINFQDISNQLDKRSAAECKHIYDEVHILKTTFFAILDVVFPDVKIYSDSELGGKFYEAQQEEKTMWIEILNNKLKSAHKEEFSGFKDKPPTVF